MVSLSPLGRSKVYECTTSVLHAAFQEVRDDSSRSVENVSALVAAVEAASGHACADFKEKWNDLHPDPLMRLPVELTSKCFRMLTTRGRFTVSHVCRAWRRAALADPFLWTDLHFSFCRRHSIDELATLLSRSHPAPFHFSWDEESYSDSDGPSVDDDEFFGAMLELVPHHVDRMQSCHVRCDGRRHRDALAPLCERPAPVLRKLVIDNQSSDPVILPGLWRAPRLHSLAVGTFVVAPEPEFAPLPSLREFRGDLRNGHTGCGLRNLFAVFPGLVSLNLTRITAEDLAAFPALPPSLADIAFDPKQGRLVDYTAFVENALGDNLTVRRFCARYATCIPATIDALARTARRGTWSLCIEPRGAGSGNTGATVSFGSDDERERYEIKTVTNEWWLREPTLNLMRANSARLASLTLPWSALLRLASESESATAAGWDRTLPSLRALTVTAYGRSERRKLATLAAEPSSSSSSAFTPLRAPQLEALVIKNSHISLVDSWLALAAVIPRLVAYDRSRLTVARFEVSRHSNLALDSKDVLDLAHMARRVLLETGGSESVIAEFIDGERVSGPLPRPSDLGSDDEDECEDDEEDE